MPGPQPGLTPCNPHMACVHVVNDAPYAPRHTVRIQHVGTAETRSVSRSSRVASGTFPPANYRYASIQDNDNTTTTFLIAGTKGKTRAGTRLAAAVKRNRLTAQRLGTDLVSHASTRVGFSALPASAMVGSRGSQAGPGPWMLGRAFLRQGFFGSSFKTRAFWVPRLMTPGEDERCVLRV